MKELIIIELTKIWEENPSWRFGQLLSNVIGEIVYKNKISDIFFPEDEFFLKALQDYRKNHSMFNYGQDLFNKAR